MTNSKIGQFIADRRKELGMRQIDLGKKVSYSVQAISKIEKGLSEPAGTLLPSLCNALELTLEDFFAMSVSSGRKNPVPSFDGLTFAENISYLRLKEGLSQHALAAIIKVSKRSVANYERGSSVPNFSVVQAYVSHFGLTPSNLYFTTLTPKVAPKNHIKGKIIWGTFGSLAILAAVIGGTSPLWMKKNAANYQGAYIPEETTSSSSAPATDSSSSSSIEISSYDD